VSSTYQFSYDVPPVGNAQICEATLPVRSEGAGEYRAEVEGLSIETVSGRTVAICWESRTHVDGEGQGEVAVTAGPVRVEVTKMYSA
jgi:hypothetical protein